MVIRHFENDLPYHDSLSFYFWQALLSWNESISMVGYEALKNIGFEILENDSLQKEVLELFEVKYKWYHESMRWGE